MLNNNTSNYPKVRVSKFESIMEWVRFSTKMIVTVIGTYGLMRMLLFISSKLLAPFTFVAGVYISMEIIKRIKLTTYRANLKHISKNRIEHEIRSSVRNVRRKF